MLKMEKDKLNLGCFERTFEDYINLDVKKFNDRIDVVWDLNDFPYPFEDNIFIEVEARAILDHLKSESSEKCLNEIHRICKNGAIVKIETSFGTNYLRSIDHYRGFTFGTFKRMIYTQGNGDTKERWTSNTKQWKIIKMDATPSFFGKFLPKFIRNNVGEYFNGFMRNIIIELGVVKSGNIK